MMSRQAEADAFNNEKEKVYAELSNLKTELAQQQSQRALDITDCECEKIEAIEKMRKEMLF